MNFQHSIWLYFSGRNVCSVTLLISYMPVDNFHLSGDPIEAQ